MHFIIIIINFISLSVPLVAKLCNEGTIYNNLYRFFDSLAIINTMLKEVVIRKVVGKLCPVLVIARIKFSRGAPW